VKRRALYLFLALLLVVIVATMTLAREKKHPAYAMDERQRAIHALNRLTFGPRPGDVERVLSVGVDRWIDQQLHPDRIDDSALTARLAPLRSLRMSTTELTENFPPQPVIKAVAEGREDMPRDPMRRAVYQAQLEKYRERQDNKQDTSQHDTKADDVARRQAHEAAKVQIDRLLDLPPDQRFNAVLRMDSESRQQVVRELASPQQSPAFDSFTPEQRETLLAMQNPQQVVDGELRQAKLLRAVYSERQLDEVMTDFWFNHFNVFLGKGADRYLVTGYERDVIRPYALGKFKDLLLATAQSPAMLFYLDNWMSVGPDSDAALGRRPQPPPRTRMVWRAGIPVPVPVPPRPQPANKKANRTGINENYARELMELHTLGVNGGYTQKDVAEVARVFTGWTVKEPRKGGSFEFNERMHEPGDKHVLGHRIKPHGEGEGKQVLDILAHHPSTAHFICTKLAQRFVSDDPPAVLVDRMAQTFLHKDGDIREVLLTMFRSPEFWSPEAYRAKVKTPLEFVASTARASGADIENPAPLVQVLNKMGMPLYGAQPPTGYSTNADVWVNSSALLDRMNFALGLAAGRIPEVKIDTTRLLSVSGDTDSTLGLLEQSLLGDAVSKTTHETVLAQIDDPKAGALGEKRPPNVALITGLLLGSPEFQRR
jgi:uncharacterized protein (DUF1800 family)